MRIKKRRGRIRNARGGIKKQTKTCVFHIVKTPSIENPLGGELPSKLRTDAYLTPT